MEIAAAFGSAGCMRLLMGWAWKRGCVGKQSTLTARGVAHSSSVQTECFADYDVSLYSARVRLRAGDSRMGYFSFAKKLLGICHFRSGIVSE